ncbi:MAG TPA: basic amino acid ABC transporter substrate-binding protein [Candidatus Deferrimicrobium sp.]|nr:basic amino acid ABC transporter substrate-binding protein [Candidatus Deferrimicrobium sp.]
MRNFTKKTIAASLVLCLGIIAGCGTTKPTTTTNVAPAEKKVLKVGSEAAYAPFEYKDEKTSEITGFDIELVTAVGKAAGFDEVKIENTAWDGLIPALNSKKTDIVISAMTITDERKQSALFSDKYFQATQYIAVKEGSTIKGSADLKGKRVAVQTNTTGQFVSEKLGVKEIKKFDTTPDALNALKIGAVDAVVADSPVVLWFIKQNPDAKVTSVTGDFDKEYYGMAMKLDNKELADKINAGLKQVKDSGKYNAIYKKYFNVDAPQF